MRKSMNKPDMESFIQAFMSYYKSPGINVKWEKMCYEKPFCITELRAAYRVTSGGVTRRFATLYFAAKFLFVNHFSQKHVHYIDVPYRRIKTLQNASLYLRKIYAGKFVNALSHLKAKLQPICYL